MAASNGKGTNEAEGFTFVMECRDSGVYQTFQHDAETRDEARPHLERKAVQAGWDLACCRVL